MALTISEEKPDIAKFLMEHQIGTLATVDADGQPHATTIYFVIDVDLRVYFISKEGTTKIRDLMANPKVGFSVYDALSQSTVQLTGEAAVVEDTSRLDDIFNRILTITANTSDSHVPPVSKIQGGEYKLYCIAPKKVRLAEYTKPEQGEEDEMFETATVDPT